MPRERYPAARVAGQVVDRDRGCARRGGAGAGQATPGALAGLRPSNLRRAKELVQALDAQARVVELEELLLRREREREELGEARAHPRGGIEPVGRLQEARVLLDRPLEELHAGRAACGD